MAFVKEAQRSLTLRSHRLDHTRLQDETRIRQGQQLGISAMQPIKINSRTMARATRVSGARVPASS